MKNNLKKRTITGVAIISGAILVSVSVAGTVKLINEANATESEHLFSAQTTNLMATNTTITKNGIKYSLDSSTKQATVISLEYDKNASTAVEGNLDDIIGLYINIPQSVSDESGNTYSVKTIGDGAHSIFSTNLMSQLKKMDKPYLKIILPKTTTEVATNAIKGYNSSSNANALDFLEIINLANKTTYAKNSIEFISDILYVKGVPGNGIENLVDSNNYERLYKVTTNNSSKR